MDLRAILAGVAFAVMWSSAFTSARIIATEAPPLLALSLRFAISGALAILIAMALGQTWRMSRAQWRLIVVFGICQNALYLGLNFVAMQRVEAGLAAIVAASLPLWVALAGYLFRDERVGSLGLAGLIAGFVGVALIMGSRLSAGLDPTGLALCVLGVLALTVATMSLSGASAGGNVLMVVGLQMVVGSAVLLPIGLALEVPEFEPSLRLTLAFLYTTLVPGLAATLVWFWLVRRIGTVRAAAFHFLNPFLGVAIASLILNEVLGALDLIGVAIITAGIVAVQMARRRV